jgi:hypothetical protein
VALLCLTRHFLGLSHDRKEIGHGLADALETVADALEDVEARCGGQFKI